MSQAIGQKGSEGEDYFRRSEYQYIVSCFLA